MANILGCIRFLHRIRWNDIMATRLNAILLLDQACFNDMDVLANY